MTVLTMLPRLVKKRLTFQKRQNKIGMVENHLLISKEEKKE